MQEALKAKANLNILRRHARWVSLSLRIFDFTLILFSGCLAFFVKFGLGAFPSALYLGVMVLGAFLGLFSFQFLGVYSPFRGRKLVQQLRELCIAWLWMTLLLAFLMFFTKTGEVFSRAWLFEWMFLGWALSFLSRFFLAWGLSFFRERGYNSRSVVILGSGALAERVAEKLDQDRAMGYQLVCFLDREVLLKDKNLVEISGHPVNPIPENLELFLAENKIDEVWIAVPLESFSWLKELMHQLRFSTVNIKIIPDIFELNLVNHSIGDLGGMPVINLRSTPMQGFSRVVKSIEDKVLASLILLGISPLLMGIAIAVKLSSKGPVFYRQERVSLNNKPFMMLKFRSMPIDAEAKVGAVWAKPGENRATKVGAFLRKTSLDELPQFINVLKGDMSIVGPRPERPVFIEKFKEEIPGYMQKHMVKAGITGWAQVNGWRGSTDLQKRVEYDLFYIEHWSLWFDLKIIFLTIFKGFLNKNAY
jgi:putative colanic acid biosynthesis UDP-glucose lipid carrier transferase